jgi:hypothetical protein
MVDGYEIDGQLGEEPLGLQTTTQLDRLALGRERTNLMRAHFRFTRVYVLDAPGDAGFDVALRWRVLISHSQGLFYERRSSARSSALCAVMPMSVHRATSGRLQHARWRMNQRGRPGV